MKLKKKVKAEQEGREREDLGKKKSLTLWPCVSFSFVASEVFELLPPPRQSESLAMLLLLVEIELTEFRPKRYYA